VGKAALKAQAFLTSGVEKWVVTFIKKIVKFETTKSE
jgi:hypothetical protein